MVKRTVASLILIFLAAVSIVAQIDWNKQIKNAPAISQGNLLNIRVVDGVKFAQSAAGINAADADLGAGTNGEIWVPSPSVLATDAQISISGAHTLRIFGLLRIDANLKGPILLGNGSSVICSHPGANNATTIFQQTSGGTIPSMVRATVQDGSEVYNLIQGCQWYANGNAVTNGVIDATGFTSLGSIRDTVISNYNSGWGIFIQDNQTGILAGTNNLEIQNVTMSPGNGGAATGGCININHSSTNNVLLFVFNIQDVSCVSGASITTAPFLFSNSSTSGNQIREINLQNAIITSVPGGQPGVTFNGIYQGTAKAVTCYSPGSGANGCVNITSNTQGANITVDNVTTFPASNSTTVVDTLSGVTLNGLTLGKYDSNLDYTLKVTTPNLNNIRVVDGVRFAQTAAGINAADADLGTGVQGEIWLPTGCCTATDAQISIRATHTLRIFGTLTINAQTQGPILLGASGTGPARISCSGTSGATNINNVGTGITSMIRQFTQDGSQGQMQVDGCRINAGATTVTNGVIDASGVTNGPSWIRDNQIFGFTSGWGIFIQDIQSGSLNGTNNIQMSNNVITATGTGGCIEITHSSTNAVVLNEFTIQDTNCTAGASITTAPIVLQNLSSNPNLLRHLNLFSTIISSPSGQSGITVGGVQLMSIRLVECLSASPCINITNNADNSAIMVDNIIGQTTSLQDSINNTTISAFFLLHYELLNGTGYSYLPSVSYLQLRGLLPTSSATSCGTGCTTSNELGSTNNGGTVNMTAGTGASAAGTMTLTFNTTQSSFGTNSNSCVFELQGAWASGATQLIINRTATFVTVSWNNNGTALTNATGYGFNYWCTAK